MKILITGSNGQLGNELQKIVATGTAEIGSVSEEIKNSEVFAMDVDTLDITNLEQVKRVLNEIKPTVVINCAAATNVDGCEANQDLAFKINSLGPRNLAMVCEEIGAKIVQVSTDYVFSGVGETPLKESDLVAPVSVYGKTKLLGEEFVRDFSSKYYIVRTSWVFNINGKNFIETMLRLSKANNQLSIVNDQIGSPTYTKDLSRLLVDMLETSKYGLYHATNEGYCSWYEFANTIFKLANINIDIKAINSNEYASRAKRPMNSKLSKDKLIEYGFKPLPHWEDALKDYLIRRGDLLI